MADRIPEKLRPWLDAETEPLMSREALARYTPEMMDWPAHLAWRVLFKPTAFHAIRMEAEVGPVCAVTSPAHPRFPYFSYVPMRAQVEGVAKAPILLTVHGSERNAYAARDRFAAFAEATGCFVIAPLFPMDLSEIDPDEQYKRVYTSSTRYDLIVLALIEEFSRLVGVEFGPLLLHGYSGGGQFVNRFLYLHGQRVAAASIGAPGYVTLPDLTRPWPVGLHGLSEIAGQEIDLAVLNQTALHLMIGEQDVNEIEYYSAAELGLSEADYRAYGTTRRERLDRLADAYRGLGLAPVVEVVPGLAHATDAEPAIRFFQNFLAKQA